MEIRTYKAEPLAGEIDDLTLVFSEQPPDFSSNENWLNQTKEHYRQQANIIVSEMAIHVPGGLFDAIFAEMAAFKAGVFVIPYSKKEAGK